MTPLGVVFNLYHILYGIAALASKIDWEDLAARGKKIFMAKALSSILGGSMTILGVLVPQAAKALLIPMIIIAFAIEIFYLAYLWQAYKALHNAALDQ